MEIKLQFYVLFCRKMIYALYLSRKIIYTLFVAKTIYAVLLESFCALNFAIWKVQTFWASERAIDEIRGPIAKNGIRSFGPNKKESTS